ncbi:hypothetical protein JVU11DRAFT_4521 [Chiua virens]|nr:hypothetical protein JVU11DRAFT_4521 [Chiua virens]
MPASVFPAFRWWDSGFQINSFSSPKGLICTRVKVSWLDLVAVYARDRDHALELVLSLAKSVFDFHQSDGPNPWPKVNIGTHEIITCVPQSHNPLVKKSRLVRNTNHRFYVPPDVSASQSYASLSQSSFLPTFIRNSRSRPPRLLFGNHANLRENEDLDACQLVAIGLGLNQYSCSWMSNGQRCNKLVLGQDVTDHLRVAHRDVERDRRECHWDGCGEEVGKGSLVRHVQEKHLGYRWPCPRCGTTFTRRGVMDVHRTACQLT